MLTDIFSERYAKRVIWENVTEIESKLLMQCYRIVAEQVIPYHVNGKESDAAKPKWQSVHDRLSMELGVRELAPKYYSHQTTWMGKPHTMSGSWSIGQICETFITAQFAGSQSPDRFIKDRISFVELAFRQQEQEIAERLRTADLRLKPWAQQQKDRLQAAIHELNERFRRAGTQLNYHNGYIQIASDELVEAQVEKPFWALVSDPVWKNVDTDMKEAFDRRDANERDPALYAAKALESTIKIVCDKKGWTTGMEKGAHSYIDNLGSAKNGAFVDDWERDALKNFFTSVRNPFGHGAGSAEMPQLSQSQTDWAIETCVSWVKTLIKRM